MIRNCGALGLFNVCEVQRVCANVKMGTAIVRYGITVHGH